jgi:alcohol dehydrogenase, propanol-preferring
MMMTELMRAWRVECPGPVTGRTFGMRNVRVPTPADDEVLVRVRACGVCPLDLRVVEGELPVRKPGLVPGHEIVGEVVSGPYYAPGTRVGVPWLRSTCGTCMQCLRGAENLCPESRHTGWDFDGGFAEYVTAPADHVYELPEGYSDEELAPLLCAGISGFRALWAAELPLGGALGIYGFGARARMAAQIAVRKGITLYVVTRSAKARVKALALGATWVGDPGLRPPLSLDAAISFAPSGELTVSALEALQHGGTLVLAGDRGADVPPLDYERHLFHERRVRSVRGNIRQDGWRFLHLAAQHRLQVGTTRFSLDRADDALAALASGSTDDSIVLVT